VAHNSTLFLEQSAWNWNCLTKKREAELKKRRAEQSQTPPKSLVECIQLIVNQLIFNLNQSKQKANRNLCCYLLTIHHNLRCDSCSSASDERSCPLLVDDSTTFIDFSPMVCSKKKTFHLWKYKLKWDFLYPDILPKQHPLTLNVAPYLERVCLPSWESAK
jgi:hypothetical protein